MTSNDELQEPMRIVNKLSFAVFVPLYFALVGYQLDLSRTFDPRLIAGVFVVGCLVKLLSTIVAARLASFAWPDAWHLAITLNARGGPGIVLASVAFDARIINGELYTALVLLAVGTSQIAGAWLERAIRHAEPLTGEVLVLPEVLPTAPAPLAVRPGDSV
jgi:Kef-type K+ transport system membrane component KefB